MDIDVEIIAVGNELLLGDVLDTNTHWLCQQVSELGGTVRRAVMVPDRTEVIGDALSTALGREPRLIILTGGLGPTSDDLTLAALATQLQRPLEVHEQALKMVQAAYDTLADRGLVHDARMTEERRKMAVLPRGAEPLHNQVGAAPGVLLQTGGTWIVCLPGVPAEMKSIFSASLAPLLGDLFEGRVFLERVLVTDCGDESLLAPIVDRLAADHLQVYVKSRAQEYGEIVQLRITLSLSGDGRLQVRSLVDAAERDLAERLARAGISILDRADAIRR